MKDKLYLFILLFSITVSAQQKLVTTVIDTTKNKIGAEFKLTLKTNVDTLSKVVFPNVKNVGALEVIQSYPIDTIKSNDRYELIKKYGLTQFDSGKYTIPRLPVTINNKTFFTDSIRVQVSSVAVDTLKQKMYDIKDIVPVKSGYDNWWKYLLGLLVLAGVIWLIYFLLKRYKNKKTEEPVYATPIEKATSLLKLLESKQLWQKGEVKTYYSELTDIARDYIEEAIEIPAKESTTSELIVALRNISKKKRLSLAKDTLQNLERVLKQADLVKFAKSRPLDYEIEEDRKKIENTIVTIHKSIPVVVEADEENALDAFHQENLRKKKQQKRKKQMYAAAAFAIVLAIGITISSKGFANVSDSIFGNDSKDLLEGEWVFSEYGNPGVKIETPEVLVRKDASAIMPKESMAFVKDMNYFEYGNMSDFLYVAVATSTFAKETELDLNKSYEGILQVLELKGGKNIFMKPEDFKTQQGVDGLRAFGNLTFDDANQKKSGKIYCEILLFKQENGLQQVIVMHEEGDQYGAEILTRVINSVELKKASE